LSDSRGALGALDVCAATIYIQMQLCQQSLHDFLYDRNFVHPPPQRVMEVSAILPLLSQVRRERERKKKKG
jgi:hypothetical protein